MTAVVLDGIVLGLQFGILGAGLTLVFGLGGVLNLAHGQIAVLAAIVIARLMDSGASTALAIAIGIVSVALLGVLIDLTLMKPVYRLQGESRVLLGLLLMLGFASIIDGILEWRYPIEALSLRVTGDPVSILGVPMRPHILVTDLGRALVGADVPVVLAVSIHMALGLLIFPFVFVLGRAALGAKGTVVPGIVFGVILWLIAQTIPLHAADPGSGPSRPSP